MTSIIRHSEIHVLPAYGRDYKSKAAVIKDWQDKKDFRDALTGRYLNADTELPPNTEVWVRYDKARKIIKI